MNLEATSFYAEKIAIQYSEGRQKAVQAGMERLLAVLVENPEKLGDEIKMTADPKTLETFLGLYGKKLSPEVQAKIVETIEKLKTMSRYYLQQVFGASHTGKWPHPPFAS